MLFRTRLPMYTLLVCLDVHVSTLARLAAEAKADKMICNAIAKDGGNKQQYTSIYNNKIGEPLKPCEHSIF